MPQTNINSAIMEYITNNRHHYTRYQIDHYLLDKGYSPEEIEAVWDYYTPKPVVPRKIPKSILTAEIAAFLTALLLAGLGVGVFNSWWPFVLLGNPTPMFGLASLATSIFGGMLWYYFVIIPKDAKNQIFSSLCTITLAGFALLIFGFSLLGISLGNERISELDSISINSQTYHLVSTSCYIDDCLATLVIYRCKTLEIGCENIHHYYFRYIEINDKTVWKFEGANATLKYDRNTNEILVIYSGKELDRYKSP